MKKKEKKVCFATFPDKVGFFKLNYNIALAANEKGKADFHETINIKWPSRKKKIAHNIYKIETTDTIYYCLASSNSRLLDQYIAVTQEVPEIGKGCNLTRLIYHYGGFFEDKIYTSEVRKMNKICDYVYKIKTNHTYYVIVA